MRETRSAVLRLVPLPVSRASRRVSDAVGRWMISRCSTSGLRAIVAAVLTAISPRSTASTSSGTPSRRATAAFWTLRRLTLSSAAASV